MKHSRRQVWSWSWTSVFVLASAGVARGEELPPTPDGAAAADDATARAAYSQPQVPTFRGGSLGMPSPAGAKVVQAATAAKFASEEVTGGSSVDFDLFTKIGGLELDDTIRVDIIGERYQQAIPQIIVGAPGALPRMVLTPITSAGLRVRYQSARRSFDVFRVDELPASVRQGSEAADQTRLTARRIFAGSTGFAYSGGFRLLHPSVDGLDAAVIGGMAGELIIQKTTTLDPDPACTKKLAEARTKASAESAATQKALGEELELLETLDQRLKQADDGMKSLAGDDRGRETLTRSVEQRRADAARALAAEKQRAETLQAIAAAPELVCAPARRRSYFGSLSATYLNSQLLPAEDATMLELPAVTEVRAMLGAELQVGTELGVALLPRVGGYVSLSRATWRNAYAQAAQAPDIEQWQAELAFYASGHFTGGFSGLVSFGVLLPYGHDDEPQGFINISPSIGSPLGGGK